MDIRLRRDDLEKLLTLVESGRSRDVSDAASNATVGQHDVGDPAAGSTASPNAVLGAFNLYFDRGVQAAGTDAGVEEVLSQAQSYGATPAVTDLLRRWTVDTDGQPVKTAYLLGGGVDGFGRPQLPTLEHVRDNYRTMTGGGELPASGAFDAAAIGDRFVVGDGAAEGSVVSMFTLWNRNHNLWVDRLKADTGGAWSENEYFEAARVINASEYQRVVFTEFAEAISQPDLGEREGVDGLDANGGSEFGFGGANVLSFMSSDTFDIIDKSTGQRTELSLGDTLAGTGTAAAAGTGHGMSKLLASAAQVPSDSSLHPVLDITALATARNRDSAPTFNQMRADLFVLTGLASMRPYSDWSDFQNRNHLSDDVVAELKAAYPDGVDKMDVWVGGLAEAPADGQFGPTLGWLVRDEIGRQSSDALPVEQLEGLPFEGAPDAQSLAAIVGRHSGFADLPAKLFLANDGEVGHVITLGDGDDLYVGTAGNDIIIGNGGNDVIHGGGGNDMLIGDAAGPREVESGEDALVGSADADLSDVFDGVDGGHGPSGHSHVPEISIPPGPAHFDGDAGRIGAHDSPRSIGPSGNDTLFGDAGDDAIFGGRGNDTMSGGTGNDFVMGEQGDDTITGDAGDDVLSGGSGNDTVSGGAGQDMVFGGSGSDALSGGSGDDTVLGGSGDDVLQGNSGDDVLLAGSGEDALFGGAGNDILGGGDGNDLLLGDDDSGDAGVIIMGTSKDDGIVGSSSGDVLLGGNGGDIIAGGAGTDAIDGGADRDLIDGGSGDDIIGGGRGDDILYGGAGDDIVDGGSGNDRIEGGSGNDIVRGGSGDDYLSGGSGEDHLYGGSGSNVYDGGSGNDWVQSISGRDTIVLQPGFGNDFVEGFDSDSSGQGGQNRIDVSAYGFDNHSIGTDILILAMGDDTVITIGSDTLTLLSVNAQTIDRNDFIFS